ncbi:MAG TPA: alpha/beta hydrolase [Candidatus Nanopelagicales bacterium]
MLHFVDSGPVEPGGPPDAGPPLVLLHAFPMDGALWAAQRRALGREGRRVITPDLPGFGGSPLSEAPPSLDVVADEVAALLDELRIERAIVGGLSMGGYVTMAMLRRHRQRVAAVVLADTKASADTVEAAANRHSMADAVEAAGTTAQVAEAMLPNLLGATTHASRPQVVATVRRWITAQRPAAVAWAQRAMAARPDALADLAAFGGPVLCLTGAEDAIATPADAAAMAEAARSGGSQTTVVEVPGAGHLSAIEDPDAVTGALRGWLTALD